MCLGPDINGYDHVGIRLDGRYYDVRGEMTAEEFIDAGGDYYAVEDIQVTDIEPIEWLLGLQQVPFPYEDIEDIDEAREAVRRVFGSLFNS